MIARLREDEIPAAIALWEAAGLAHPWNDSMRDIRLALGCPTATILAAHDDTGALTGTVMAGFDGHRGWLYSLAVAESARGRGLGAELVTAAEAFLREQGAPVIRLMVRRDNEGVGAFYESIGYEQGDFLVFGKRFQD
jgi:ribosomal protein S18 acetylase RimI-like enzyme